jgi:uncharacterized damage-inducible protein DinB
MQIGKPHKEHYPRFYDSFIASVKSNNLTEELTVNCIDTIRFFKAIKKEKLLFKYQKNKWTIIQVFKHLIDCEKMYFERSKHFSKLNKSNLPNFDVNKAMALVSEDELEIRKLVKEFKVVRKNQINFIQELTLNQLDFKGKANGSVLTIRSLGYISIGHSNHHISIIKERYLT